MKNYSRVLLNLVMVLYGHEIFAADTEKADVSVSAKQEQTESKKSSRRQTQTSPAITGNAPEAIELEKPLDLSVPFDVIESAGHKSEQNTPAQSLFAAEKSKQRRTLELNGGAVMTQEPEGEKQQSVDGAGIVFSLKP